MSLTLTCPACSQVVQPDNGAHRGLLINSRAALGSHLISNREMLVALKKKRWSKQHAKQHEIDLKTIAQLEANISRDELLLVQIVRALETYNG